MAGLSKSLRTSQKLKRASQNFRNTTTNFKFHKDFAQIRGMFSDSNIIESGHHTQQMIKGNKKLTQSRTKILSSAKNPLYTSWKNSVRRK